MGILFPHDEAWTPATWIGRALFYEMLEDGGLPTKLAAALRFALDAATYVLDYREATVEDLRVLSPFVRAAVERIEAQGAAAMALPEFFLGTSSGWARSSNSSMASSSLDPTHHQPPRAGQLERR